MSINDAADAAVDTWIAAMSPASANPTAVRDAMRPLARALCSVLSNYDVDDVSTDISTSSGTYATILTANVTTTLASSYLDISFTASGAHITNAATTFFPVLVDGVPVKGTQSKVPANYGWSAAYRSRAAVAAGAHTVVVQWKTDNATARINASSLVEEHGHLHVREVF